MDYYLAGVPAEARGALDLEDSIYELRVFLVIASKLIHQNFPTTLKLATLTIVRWPSS